MVSIEQYVATYVCSYVALALAFLLRCLLIASWFPKATQLPKTAHTSRGCGNAPSNILKSSLSEIAS